MHRKNTTPVKSERYRIMVERIGNKQQVANLLGENREIVSRRCHGKAKISREAYLGLKYLHRYYMPIRRRRERERSAIKPHRCIFR